MTPALDAPSPAASRPERRTHGQRTCPECLATFEAKDAGQLFCTPPHRRAWNNRWTVRGAVIAPLAAVARVTRNGSRGSEAGRLSGWRAGQQVDALLARYRREDRAERRMDWEQYLALRYATGFDPL